MFHKVFYPHDVTVGVPYVAPLNMAREDQRLYNFFDVVGTEAEREKIHQLQIQCFEKQDSLEILLKQKALQKEWSFAFGYEKAVEYTILEYPFAFWQWGSVPFSEIPTGNIPADSLFNHLNKVADFTFFEDGSMEEMRPFFWAALTEIGMYGYNVEPFKQYLGDTTNYTFDFSAPNGLAPIYNNSTLNYVKQQLDRYGNNMIYIVGGLDPWGATAYNPTANTNAIRLTLKDGHHGTRLKHFSVQEKEEVYHLLEEWMNVSLKD